MNILIIGLGSIAHKHIAAIEEVYPGASVYAYRSSKDAAPVEGVRNIFSLDNLDISPDFIIISNPTQKHEETIESCLPIGCPLFIEKPALADTVNTQKLLNGINQRNIITYVACNLRFHPVVEFLKEHLTQHTPRINEVNAYCGSYLPDWRPGKDFRKIYSANSDMGGGVHLDLIHELDYCTWLFGTPDKTTTIRRNASSLNIDAPDYANYILSYPEFSASVILNYYRCDPKRTMEIVFDNETWTANLLKGEITNNKDQMIFKSDFDMKSTYTRQMQYFKNCMDNQIRPMNSIEEAIKTLHICLQN